MVDVNKEYKVKSEEAVRAKLKEIEQDERLSYPCASIFENAPLAIIQTLLETQVSMLKWVLSEEK